MANRAADRILTGRTLISDLEGRTLSLTAESEPVFSPDGRWIAHQSGESGREFQAPSTVVLHAVEEIRRLTESSR